MAHNDFARFARFARKRRNEKQGILEKNFKTSKRHNSAKSKKYHGDFCMGSGN
jgi:hypothetical protein